MTIRVLLLSNNRILRSFVESVLDNIKIDLVEIKWGHVNWIGLAQDSDQRRASVTVVVNFQVS